VSPAIKYIVHIMVVVIEGPVLDFVPR